MIATCQPLPRSAAEETLQVVARAIRDHPEEDRAQRESRTNQMVHATMGFEPRDGLEYMLSSIVFGHFNLILDSMHDIFVGQTEAMKARTKSTIVALDRSMLAMVKELRLSRKRPLAKWALDAQQAEAVSPPVKAATPDGPPPEPPGFAPEMHQAAETASSSEMTYPAEPEPAWPLPLPAQDHTPAMTPRHEDAARPPLPDEAAHAGTPPPDEADDRRFARHFAAFQEALASAPETLAEAPAFDDVETAAAAGN